MLFANNVGVILAYSDFKALQMYLIISMPPFLRETEKEWDGNPYEIFNSGQTQVVKQSKK